MARSANSDEISRLLALIDSAFNGKSWHGPTLRGCLRRVDADEASWRPAKGRHTIAEQVLHAAYWKYAARRRLLDDARGSFPLKGSNWFPMPSPWSVAAWRDCLALLDEQHRRLREAVAGFPPRALNTVPRGAKVTQRRLIEGVAFHDVYHAGQIRLIRAMYPERRTGS